MATASASRSIRVPGGVEGDARLLVLRAQPARAQAELEAPAREHRWWRPRGEDGRVVEVDREDERAHAQPAGRERGGGQGGDRRELVPEMVRHREDREAELFGAAGLVGPGLARREGPRDEAEAEGAAGHRHTTL